MPREFVPPAAMTNVSSPAELVALIDNLLKSAPPPPDAVLKKVASVLTKARKAGVGAGIHQGMPPTTPGMTPDFASRWIKEYGCNVYVHAADVNLFSTQLKRDLLSIRGASNGAAEAPAEELASEPMELALRTSPARRPSTPARVMPYPPAAADVQA